MDDMDDDDLLEALGVSVETKTTGGRTPRQERVIAGFEDILQYSWAKFPQPPNVSATPRESNPLHDHPGSKFSSTSISPLLSHLHNTPLAPTTLAP